MSPSRNPKEYQFVPACLDGIGHCAIAELEQAAGEDWPEVRDDPSVVEALAHAVITRRQRERGECPPHWTAHGECACCGPVFLWPGSPARVLGCPWCFNRAEGRPISKYPR